MNEFQPLVSVVIPVYNREDTVKKAIDSVLSQTYDNLEVIVVDDNSTDRTRGVVEEIDDARVDLLVHDENRGAAIARNTGIDAADGDFIAFQDSDDVWHPEKLKKQIEVFENASSDVGVVYTAFWQVRDGVKRLVPDEDVAIKEGDIQHRLLEGNFVTTQATVVRRECFEKVGTFHAGLPRLQDWELWIRISEHFEFRFVDEPLVTAYVQPDSISNDRKALAEALATIIDKHGAKFDERALSKLMFKTGHLSMLESRPEVGKKYLRKSVEIHFRIVVFLYYVVSRLDENTYKILSEALRPVQKNTRLAVY